MRIAVDVRMIHSSGIGRVIENILTRIIVLRPEWEFYLLGCPEELLQFPFSRENNVQIIHCESPIYSVSEQVELMRRIPSDLDWFWSPHYNVPVFYSGRLLVTIHDVFHLAMPAFVKGIHRRLYAKGMFSFAVSKAAKIICVSQFTAKELTRLTQVSSKKLQVIYNGVDEKWHFPGTEARLYERPYFIYVGNIKPHKNLIRLLKAYASIKDTVEQDLLLVGKKTGFLTGMDEIDSYIQGLGDRVSFTGWVEDEALKTYVAQADAMVFPSLYEGFGLPPLEAMAAGTPVLVSKAASLPEICGAGALYCDPYDIDDIASGMQRILRENHSVQVMKHVVQQYSWDTTVAKMVAVFEAL